jgi:uncharacterized protein YbbC (DUF1343 family)/CubicO group peptidase (beta-lactamase class C family)
MKLPRRLLRKLACFFLIHSSLAACMFAAPQPPKRVSWAAARMDSALAGRIDKAVAKAIDDGRMSGCVVLIGRREGIVFEKAYGDRCVEPEKEPMTTDTLFDMASLTKPLATATSIMILVERGQLRLSDKVSKFFPEFAANGKDDVTVEHLLTHSSGLIPDNPLGDYSDGWQSAKKKICDLSLLSKPGTAFKYSDVNFILLGKIVEEVTGIPEDEFVKKEIYDRLGMRDTGYNPSADLKARAETIEKRKETNGTWIKGEVHDPRAFAMGGVAGHAGLFSTANDLAIYSQMMLQKGRLVDIQILSEPTFEEMIRPRDIDGHRRALGWDTHSGYSRNRGELMSDRAFGHGGFTGTSMWIDPELNLCVIFLGDRLHPDGAGEVNDLAGRIGSMACEALQDVTHRAERSVQVMARAPKLNALVRAATNESSPSPSLKGRGNLSDVKLGIDVLVRDEFKQLAGKRVGLITNQTGLDSSGATTIDRLHDAKNVQLVALFSPEHGIRGALEQAKIEDSVDEKTGIAIYSLYGERRKPSKEQLSKLDALVFDVQDVGCRFYTNTATMALSLEAASDAGKEFFVLDRPDPIGGEIIEGPLLDSGLESFVGIHNIPLRYGLTIGELAKIYAAERKLDVKLSVVPLEGWRRDMYQFDTNQTWTNTSPNMRSLRAAVLYTGIGVMEFTNISVGRGTDTPFEVMGAPWIHERDLALAVNEANPPGVRVLPTRFTPNASRFKGEQCHGLSVVITDWNEFRSFEFGLVVAHSLRTLYPTEWQPERLMRLLGNKNTYQQIVDGKDVADILTSINDDVSKFRVRRKQFLLYQ